METTDRATETTSKVDHHMAARLSEATELKVTKAREATDKAKAIQVKESSEIEKRCACRLINS
jgi:hypothetical protein